MCDNAGQWQYGPTGLSQKPYCQNPPVFGLHAHTLYSIHLLKLTGQPVTCRYTPVFCPQSSGPCFVAERRSCKLWMVQVSLGYRWTRATVPTCGIRCMTGHLGEGCQCHERLERRGSGDYTVVQQHHRFSAVTFDQWWQYGHRHRLIRFQILSHAGSC